MTLYLNYINTSTNLIWLFKFNIVLHNLSILNLDL